MRRSRRILAAALAVSLIAGTAAAHAGPASPTASSTPTDSTGSGVRVVAEEPGHPSAQARVAAMSVREQAASVVMGHIPTTDPAALHDYMASTHIGGFILMGANIPADEAELRALTAVLTVDPGFAPLVGIDEEGGVVTRLPWDRLPGARALKGEEPAATEIAFAGRGALLQRAGANVNFGIVADITADPGSFIYGRALGTTPEAGGAHVAAAVAGEGMQVASTLKHFPGHGAAPGDSHQTLPTTDLSREAWTSADAVPFQAGIDAGASLVMFGHLVYTAVDAVPASLSAEWHRVLRDDLGFEGVAITDDLGMLESSGDPAYSDPVANAVAALAAGNDMVLTVIGSDASTATRIIDGIVVAVQTGALPADRLTEAAGRVAVLREAQTAAGRGMVPCADCESAG